MEQKHPLSKKIILSILIGLIFTFSLSSCSNSTLILGKWKQTNPAGKDTMEFFKDGTLTQTTLGGIPISGTYKLLDDSNMKIELGGVFGVVGAQVYSYTLDGDRLLMTVLGVRVEYTRVK